MGLFGSLIGSKVKKAAAVFEGLPDAIEIRSEVVRIEPVSQSSTCYLFDERPFRGMKDGSTFWAVVADQDVTLTSRYDGSRGSTIGNSWFALTYNGMPFGFCNLVPDSDIVEELLADGKTAEVMVKVDGEFATGFPNLVAFMGDEEVANERRAEKRKQKREQELNERGIFDELRFNVTEGSKNMHVEKLRNGSRVAKLRVEPAPKGSSAKPHIFVVLGGKDAFEFSARSSAYEKLSEFVASGDKKFVCDIERRESLIDDGHYYAVWMYRMIDE